MYCELIHVRVYADGYWQKLAAVLH